MDEARPGALAGQFDAVTFDIYGTVLNWEPEIAAFFRRLGAKSGIDLDDRALLAAYDRLRGPIQNVRPALGYREVLARSFDAMASAFGLPDDAQQRDIFRTSAAAHRAWPDSRQALDDLRTGGYVLGALSNVDDASFSRMALMNRLTFDEVITAEKVGAYKPDPAHFRASLAALSARGIAKERVLHIAQSRRADIVPCNHLGLKCVWVDRPGHIFGRTGAEDARPDFTVTSLRDVALLLSDGLR